MTLEALKTYTTRYSSRDGQERVVMLQEHYDQIIALAEKGEKRGRWTELANRCEARAREWENGCGHGCEAHDVVAIVLRNLATDLRELE